MNEPAGRLNSWIIPFQSETANLTAAGGKGANLGRLARAGFPVPEGFVISTRAYLEFVRAYELEDQIQRLLAGARIEGAVERMGVAQPTGGESDTTALETLSEQIRALFSQAEMPAEMWAHIAAAYRELGEPPVAVRSSATAEDLPEMSFAGQQDTFLNVRGETALKQAVMACWSSLWTARAIGYRTRNGVAHTGVGHTDVALAVVVQRMVASEASGVLFTANPLSGLRTETVIDATLGLGEALVSGQVEPDHYVVDPAAGVIKMKTLGAKALSIRPEVQGGTQTVPEDARDRQALPDEQIVELARLGARVAELYGTPQDIEWAWADGRLHLLQARPIPSLFPVPGGSRDRLRVYFSFGAVQGMLDPMTPLGRDVLKGIFAMGADLFGYRYTPETQPVLKDAGERLWIDITPILTNSFGRQVLPVSTGVIEPTIGQALKQIWEDPQLQPGRAGVSLAARRRLAGFFLPLAGNVFLNLLSPDRRRQVILSNGEKVLAEILAGIEATNAAEQQADIWSRLRFRATVLDEVAAKRLPGTLVLFVSGVASGMASLNLVNQLAKEALKKDGEAELSGWLDPVLEATRGLPYNPTTEMDLSLWAAARTIQTDPPSREVFARSTPDELVRRYRDGELPKVAQTALANFLARYGARGLAEIDAGRERWREDPRHVFEVLNSYLQIEDPERAPDVVFRRSAERAEAAIADLRAAIRRKPGGWFKAHLLGFAARRMRALMGLREAPKFFAIRIMAILRDELLKSGQELAAEGILEQADDLVYLTLSEIEALANARGQGQDWQAQIAARRAAYRRELLRRQIPRLLLSDGRAFYEGMAAEPGAKKGGIELTGSVLTGSPVSPGSVEGRVRVVLDPRQAGLLPGEILVCPGTDPSWTPLFLSAAGLVMEVGGMMTHGAVVAREYGIPAIVGVDQATRRLKTGQRIRMDGSSGQIEVVEEQLVVNS
jgi:pyruvate,water dikinase